MQTLTAEELKDLQDRNEDFLLINTLDEGSFPQTHIPHSLNIPQSNDDFVQRVEEEAGDKSAKIVVYCASEHCKSSTEAAKKLESAGFSNVYDFEEGAEGWQAAGESLTVPM